MAEPEIFDFFPHGEFRPKQKTGIVAIHYSVKEGLPILLNSPTGTGKTSMVLAGILSARSSGEKLAVITRTHSQYRMFIQEFLAVKEKHPDLSFGLLVGRRNVCPLKVDYETCGLLRKNSLSRIKQGTSWRVKEELASFDPGSLNPKNAVCPYFINCHQVEQKKTIFNSEAIKLMLKQQDDPVPPEDFYSECIGQDRPKCPYELLKNTLFGSDVLVLHYQYLLAPEIREAASRWLGCPLDKIHLVVDEAHNLAPYLRELGSLEFSREDVLDAIKLVNEERLYDVEYSLEPVRENITEIVLLLEDLNLFMKDLFEKRGREELVSGRVEDLVSDSEMLEPDPKALEYLGVAADLVKQQFDYQKKNQVVPEDTPYPALYAISEALKKMVLKKTDRFIRVFQVKSKSRSVAENLQGKLDIDDFLVSLRVEDIDPRDSVKYLVDNFRSLSLVSGTMHPTNLYRKLLFYSDLKVNESDIPSPFPPENRIILCCSDVSSQRRFREAQENIENIREVMEALFSVDGNIAFFFTSYGLKESYLPLAKRLCREYGKAFMDENRKINKHEFLEEYKGHGNAALFGVCRGSFSEGVDFLGDAMNAVAVIGLPLSQWNRKQQKINQYFEAVFGEGVGKQIAYSLPAVTAAVQALGRCIRGPDEKGVLVLADQRFSISNSFGVKSLLPKWMQEEMKAVKAVELKSLIKERLDSWGIVPKKRSPVSRAAPKKPEPESSGPSFFSEEEMFAIVLESVIETRGEPSQEALAKALAGRLGGTLFDSELRGYRHFGKLSYLSPGRVDEKIKKMLSLDLLERIGEDRLQITDRGRLFLEE